MGHRTAYNMEICIEIVSMEHMSESELKAVNEHVTNPKG